MPVSTLTPSTVTQIAQPSGGVGTAFVTPNNAVTTGQSTTATITGLAGNRSQRLLLAGWSADVAIPATATISTVGVFGFSEDTLFGGVMCMNSQLYNSTTAIGNAMFDTNPIASGGPQFYGSTSNATGWGTALTAAMFQPANLVSGFRAAIWADDNFVNETQATIVVYAFPLVQVTWINSSSSNATPRNYRTRERAAFRDRERM